MLICRTKTLDVVDWMNGAAWLRKTVLLRGRLPGWWAHLACEVGPAATNTKCSPNSLYELVHLGLETSDPVLLINCSARSFPRMRRHCDGAYELLILPALAFFRVDIFATLPEPAAVGANGSFARTPCFLAPGDPRVSSA